MTDWRPYLDDRLIAEHDGFVVIKPADAEASIPLWCPLCDTALKDRDDEEAYLEFSCCHLCALTWAHARRDDWKRGWRPSPVEVKESLASRPRLSVVLDLD